MKLILESTENLDVRKITIETKNDFGDIWQVYESLIKPALVAWGFAESTVDEAFGQNE